MPGQRHIAPTAGARNPSTRLEHGGPSNDDDAPVAPTTRGSSGARRTHRKSRTGCKNCKKRKIKCDEARPRCWQCVRHNIECDYSQGAVHRRPPYASPVGPAETSAPVGVSGYGASQSPSEKKSSTAANSPDMQRSPGTSAGIPPPSLFERTPASVTSSSELEDGLSLHMIDLSLMHHFTTTTAPLLSPWSADTVKWWTYEVPRVAFSHPFAMQSLLALAGLHVAYSSNTSSPASVPFANDPGFHTRRAVSQNQAAMQTATSILATRNVTPETSEPLYVFSVMTVMISLAMPRNATSVFVFDSAGVTEWVTLMKGVTAIVDLGRDWLKEGGLASALKEETLPAALWKEQEESGREGWRRVAAASATNFPAIRMRGEPPLDELRAFIVSHQSPQADDEPGAGGDEESWQVCTRALDLLQHVFAAFLEHGTTLQTMRLAFSWLNRVEPDFWEQISQHQLPALLVFSYFAVLLHRLDRLWWLEGWGPHILTVTAAILDERHHKWMRWPRQQVGLID